MELTISPNRKPQTPTAPFMSPGPPPHIYLPKPTPASTAITIMTVLAIVVDSLCGQSIRLHVAGGQADGQERLCGMEGLCEELGGQREGTDVFEHDVVAWELAVGE